MALQDLRPSAAVSGLVPGDVVTVVAVSWHGSEAATVTYRDAHGQLTERIVLRSDADDLVVLGEGSRWTFDADGALFRLVAEARRIELAHLFDPMLAVSLSAVEPLPHQIQAVYGEMLPRQPLRFLLADDPGAGKTIMAGLYIKELQLRGDLHRCLIIAPGSLVAQWREELWDKFDLRFDLLTRDTVEASLGSNPSIERPRLIARLDQRWPGGHSVARRGGCRCRRTRGR